MKRLITAAAAVGLAVGLAACGGATPVAETAATTTTSSSSSSSTSPSPEPTFDSPTTPESYNFGDTVRYEDGLLMTVGKPVRFTPSEYAAAEKAPAYVKFKVTIRNTTGGTVELTVTSSLQSADRDEEEVYDSEKGLEGGPSSKLLNGRSITFTIGYGAHKLNDLVLQIAPTFDHDDAIFTS